MQKEGWREGREDAGYYSMSTGRLFLAATNVFSFMIPFTYEIPSIILLFSCQILPIRNT